MTYEAYTWMSYICAGLSGVFLVVSIFLFFKLKIKSVIGDLTGTTAKKAIDDIRNNTLDGKIIQKTSKINRDRGRVTAKITSSGQLMGNEGKSGFCVGTEKLKPFSGDNETTVLKELTNETVALNASINESNETTVLVEEERKNIIIIEEEITFINTQERIV